MSKFVDPSDPILIKKAQVVPQHQITSPQIRKIINGMLNIAYGQQKKR